MSATLPRFPNPSSKASRYPPYPRQAHRHRRRLSRRLPVGRRRAPALQELPRYPGEERIPAFPLTHRSLLCAFLNQRRGLHARLLRVPCRRGRMLRPLLRHNRLGPCPLVRPHSRAQAVRASGSGAFYRGIWTPRPLLVWHETNLSRDSPDLLPVLAI